MSLQPADPGAEHRADNRVRVMIVDDSAVARGLISRWVEEDPALSIVGKAPNGLQAVENVARYAPDVIVLDIEMPVMDGMTALPELLKRSPGAKVIMASTLTRRNAEISLRALSLGAIDYIPKPEGNHGITTSADFREELIRKIKAIGGVGDAVPAAARPAARDARASVPTALPHEALLSGPVAAENFDLRPFSTTRPAILAIGSSTGGPKALAELFAVIAPVIRSVPVIVTQHMPPTFTTILAEHIAKVTGGVSKEAEHGEPLRAGAVYVAPGGLHTSVEAHAGALRLNVYDGPHVNFCKPSVDPLFASVASIFGSSALAAILTGMGHDGAEGALEIARAGGSVIAQDQATSVVWGMPRAALSVGACSAVLPLDGIGRKLSQLLSRSGAQ